MATYTGYSNKPYLFTANVYRYVGTDKNHKTLEQYNAKPEQWSKTDVLGFEANSFQTAYHWVASEMAILGKPLMSGDLMYITQGSHMHISMKVGIAVDSRIKSLPNGTWS